LSDSKLRAAYVATTYQLTVGGLQLPVRVGEASDGLSAALAAEGVESWCFITAWNPHSEQLSVTENARRNGLLFQKITGHKFASAIAIPDDSNWPREPGFVLFDVPLPQLVEWAEAFGQNAVVVGQSGSAPELHWTA